MTKRERKIAVSVKAGLDELAAAGLIAYKISREVPDTCEYIRVSGDFDAPLPAGLSRGAVNVWEMLVAFHRPC